MLSLGYSEASYLHKPWLKADYFWSIICCIPSICKLMKLLVIASFQIIFFYLACCFFKNKISSDIEIWRPLLKRPINFKNLESYFMFAVFALKSKVSIQVILKMIQWRFCAASQQVLILNFASSSEKFPGFLRNRPLALAWIFRCSLE